MKKALSLVLTAAIGVSCLAACSKEPAETETSAAETTVEETQNAETTEAPETTAAETTEASETAADTEVTPELNDVFEQALQGFV